MNQKILLVHLLRLGDVLMLLPAIMNLRKSYPKAEIHLLLNDNCSILSSVIERYVDKIIYFQRDLIQNEIVDPNANLLSPYYEVEDFIETINSENYEYLINFTQTYMSAYLCSLIKAKSKMGMLYVDDKIQIKGDAFKRMNKEESDPTIKKSHFIDLFMQALNLPPTSVDNWKLLGLNVGSEKPYIAFQMHTNEDIKTLSSFQWVHLLEYMRPYIHDYEIKILCAPNEESKTKEFMSLVDKDIQPFISIQACSFSKALEIIEGAELLVSVDTSIKHLANFTTTRTLELSLGSSDIYRTGIYKEGSYIFQPNVSCLPCSHSQGCTMSEHLCANSINLESFADLIFTATKDPLSLNKIYPELDMNGKLYCVSSTESVFEINELNTNKNINNETIEIEDKHESNT